MCVVGQGVLEQQKEEEEDEADGGEEPLEEGERAAEDSGEG